MTERMIDNRVRKIKELEGQKKALDFQITALKDELKKEMEATGKDELQTQNFLVKWKEIISKSFDSKSFKATLPDLYTQYLVPSSCRRFTIA